MAGHAINFYLSRVTAFYELRPFGRAPAVGNGREWFSAKFLYINGAHQVI